MLTTSTGDSRRLFVPVTILISLFISALLPNVTFASGDSHGISINAHLATSTCPQIPTHFDFLAASASQLSDLGLPPRPQGDETQLEKWLVTVRNIKHMICSNQLVHTNAHSSVLNPARQNVTGQTAVGTTCILPSCTDIWSGYIVVSDTFDQIQGTWNTQCQGGGTSTVSNARELTWVGIGGVNSQYLIQTGTAYTHVQNDPNPNDHTYYP